MHEPAEEQEDSDGFDSLGLSETSLRSLRGFGYERPTPIQCAAIPIALAGEDLLGGAATGTGKTAAFLLPMVERIERGVASRGLILAPTRELAEQIAEHARQFAPPLGLRVAVIVGGVGVEPQAKALNDGTEIVIATPGRLIDLAERHPEALARFSILVLDEADRMLDLGFEPQLRQILGLVPSERQTLLFSATLGDAVIAFAQGELRNAARVQVNPSGEVPEGAEQSIYFIAGGEKVALLLALLHEQKGKTLIFLRTRPRVERLVRRLRSVRVRTERIHGDRTAVQRREALERFAAGKCRILVATNVAARGLDLSGIDHVVNFDLPELPEDYVHRVGRTARMERRGFASTFVAPDEHLRLRRIERLTRSLLNCRELPDLTVAHERLAAVREAPPGVAKDRLRARQGKLAEKVSRNASGKTKRRLKTKLKAKRRKRRDQDSR